MEEYKQITLDQWMQWKEDIRRKLEETTGNFVHIGYRLKQIRNSGMFDGAADIFEFAEREYGLGKSTVSRFIAINEKYSEGGDSIELRETFKNYSSSKLSEMLTLTDAECSLITERTTIKEIRDLKSFSRQQCKAGQIDVDGKLTPLEECIIDFFRDKGTTLYKTIRHLQKDKPDYRMAAQTMNPAGQRSHKKGILYLFMYDWSKGIKYKLLAQPEVVSMTWPEFLNKVYRIYEGYDQTDIWTDYYEKKKEKTEYKKVEAEGLQIESECGIEDSVATSQQDNKKDIDTEKMKGDIGKRNGADLADMEIREEKRTEAAGLRDIDSERKKMSVEDEADCKMEEQEGTAGSEEKSIDNSGDIVRKMDITQFEEYMPEQKVVSELEEAYMNALRDILDSIYEKAEQRQYAYAEDLLEAARGTIRKIREGIYTRMGEQEKT